VYYFNTCWGNILWDLWEILIINIQYNLTQFSTVKNILKISSYIFFNDSACFYMISDDSVNFNSKHQKVLFISWKEYAFK